MTADVHVVMMSGGAASYVAGLRVVERFGATNTRLLFSDVKGDNPSPHAGEDADTYRFLHEAAADIGAALTELRQHEDIWDVYRRRRRIGSGYAANCSFELKQKPARDWLDANCDPATTTVYIGIDYSEDHRCEAQRFAYAHKVSGCARTRKQREERPCTAGDPCSARLSVPWAVVFPLIDWQPIVSKEQCHEIAEQRGISQQRLYRAGFAHANCGGFCVKAGKAQHAQLLALHPDRYRYHEDQEQRTREHLGADVAVLNETRNGATVPLTLRAFREGIEAQTAIFDPLDFGGCGCFTDEAAV